MVEIVKITSSKLLRPNSFIKCNNRSLFLEYSKTPHDLQVLA